MSLALDLRTRILLMPIMISKLLIFVAFGFFIYRNLGSNILELRMSL